MYLFHRFQMYLRRYLPHRLRTLLWILTRMHLCLSLRLSYLSRLRSRLHLWSSYCLRTLRSMCSRLQMHCCCHSCCRQWTCLCLHWCCWIRLRILQYLRTLTVIHGLSWLSHFSAPEMRSGCLRWTYCWTRSRTASC